MSGVTIVHPIGPARISVNVIEVAITAAAGAFTSATAIPVGSRVSEALIVYDTAPYNGGATLAIGDGVTADKVFATADTSPTTAATGDIDSVPQWTTWDAGTLPVVVTLGGLPAVGAARAVVYYAEPLT